MLTGAGLQGSVGRVASVRNAEMESWHALRQKNVLQWRRRRTGRSCTMVGFWIEHTYNCRRRQRTLGKLTPVKYELAFTAHSGVQKLRLSSKVPGVL